MRLVLLGDRDAVRGFRLAGVEGLVCRTRDDVARAIAACVDRDATDLAVVVVSPSVDRLAPDLIARLQERPHWPVVAVLRDGGEAQRERRAI